MKKIGNILLLISSLLFILDSCEIDNYDGPDASFFGSIKDSQTGELIGTDIENGSSIKVYELGFETSTAQTWYIKNTGEFNNDLVFSARYDFEFSNGNFYPFKVSDFEVKPGKNQHDFEVTPYIRIKNVNITHDAGNKKVIATFSLEAGKPEVKLSEIRLFVFTDIWVGNNVKFDVKGSNFSHKFTPVATIDGANYTLSIDLNENSDLFKYNRNYYFRVGALASISGVGTVRHNYAPFVVIAL